MGIEISGLLVQLTILLLEFGWVLMKTKNLIYRVVMQLIFGKNIFLKYFI